MALGAIQEELRYRMVPSLRFQQFGFKVRSALFLALLGVCVRPVPAQVEGHSAKRVAEIQQALQAGELQRADELLQAAMKRLPHDAELLNLEGVIAAQSGKPAEARRWFQESLRWNPRSLGTVENLIRLDMDTAEKDAAIRREARALCEKILAATPGDDESRYQLATLLAWENKPKLVLAEIARLSAPARESTPVLALQCAATAADGTEPAAATAVKALAAKNDFSEADAEECAGPLRAARRTQLIEELYTAVASHHELSAGGLRMLGLAQEANAKLPAARQTLEQSFAAGGGKDAETLIDLTRVALAEADKDGALGYLAHARDIAPGDARFPYEFGMICAEKGLYGEARKALADAVELDPQNPDYNFNLGTVISFSRDPSEALPWLQKFHELRPNESAGELALGATYFRAKDYENALVWLTKAKNGARTAAEAHFYLGRIARQQGRAEDAIEELKQSVAVDAKEPDVLAELGQIYVTRREFADAEKELKQALDLDADNYAANFGLLQLYARTGDARREAQSARFDEIKAKKEAAARDMMRVIQIERNVSDKRP